MKKFIISESQLKFIVENISYQPEKIDEFVIEANSNLDKIRNTFNSYLTTITNLTINDINENIDKNNELLLKMKSFEEGISKIHDKYYNIVDLYDFLDSPTNVSQLEKITTNIDELYFSFGKLCEAHENLIDSSKRLLEFNK